MKWFIYLSLAALSPSAVLAADLATLFPSKKPSADCEAVYNEVLSEAQSGKFWYKHVQMITSSTTNGKAYCNMVLHGYDKNRGNRYTSRPIREVVDLKKNNKK